MDPFKCSSVELCLEATREFTFYTATLKCVRVMIYGMQVSRLSFPSTLWKGGAFTATPAYISILASSLRFHAIPQAAGERKGRRWGRSLDDCHGSSLADRCVHRSMTPPSPHHIIVHLASAFRSRYNQAGVTPPVHQHHHRSPLACNQQDV